MLTKEEFVKTHPDIRIGMTAYTVDGELGTIERIDEDEAHGRARPGSSIRIS